jgi:hypothetical protein
MELNCVAKNDCRLSTVDGIVKEKYFKYKYRHLDILLNVHALIYFKFKLHLKSTNNKN